MTDRLSNIELPELTTGIGIHGSMKNQEVGGPLCIGVIVGIAILIQR